MSQGAYITNSCQIHKYNYSSTNRHCTEKKRNFLLTLLNALTLLEGHPAKQGRTRQDKGKTDRQTRAQMTVV